MTGIECWFEFGSPYSYPAVMTIETRAAAAGRSVVWRPFLLGPVFKALGWEGSPFQGQPRKRDYAMRDLSRVCAREGLPWRAPSVFPRRALWPMRVAIAGGQSPWVGAYCRRVMTMNFSEDREIDDPATVAEALTDAGVAPAVWLERAASAQVKDQLRQQTEQALALGLFGAPSFRVGGELFWGHDRLADALAWPADEGAG